MAPIGLNFSSAYSNVLGDFVATPVPGTKRIEFSDFANSEVEASLGPINFIGARVFSRLPAGGYNELSMASFQYSQENGLTLLSMSANFSEGEEVAIYIQGRDKGYDEEADAFKTISSGDGPEPIENYALETGGVLDAIAAATIAAAEVLPHGSFYRSPALEESALIKGSPGTLLSLRGRLDMQADSGQYFFQIYNNATVPADGAETILACGTIEHTSGFSSEFGLEYPRGKIFSTGISWAISSTEFTKTTPAPAQPYAAIEAEYK